MLVPYGKKVVTFSEPRRISSEYLSAKHASEVKQWIIRKSSLQNRDCLSDALCWWFEYICCVYGSYTSVSTPRFSYWDAINLHLILSLWTSENLLHQKARITMASTTDALMVSSSYFLVELVSPASYDLCFFLPVGTFHYNLTFSANDLFTKSWRCKTALSLPVKFTISAESGWFVFVGKMLDISCLLCFPARTMCLCWLQTLLWVVVKPFVCRAWQLRSWSFASRPGCSSSNVVIWTYRLDHHYYPLSNPCTSSAPTLPKIWLL